MNATTKRLSSMRRNPRDWQIDQLRTVARKVGMEVRNEGGSHHIFSYSGLKDTLSVPAHRPIKPVYIRAFVDLCDRVIELKVKKESRHDQDD
ncbi:MAG: type II toxin-antitoxin system HicA family toxin [Candidatus Accumulibacter sp.]|jgi:hypothetical protein|nr:type II toxin-antitoxin system HicA family toxin [Accumulibacter sp.]